MMLGHPEAPVAEPFDVARELGRMAKRLRRVAAFDDGRQVEDGKRHHRPGQMGGGTNFSMTGNSG